MLRWIFIVFVVECVDSYFAVINMAITKVGEPPNVSFGQKEQVASVYELVSIDQLRDLTDIKK